MTCLTVVKLLKLNSSAGNAIVALSVFFLLLSCQQRRTLLSADTEVMKQPEMFSLAKGSYSGIDSAMTLVIDSDTRWMEIWNKIYAETQPRPELPEVDFSRETILAVFLGTRSTGGFSVEISRVVQRDGKIVAETERRSPRPEEPVTMALTSPFHIVRVNIPSENIEFIFK